jgi:hypothetical protein
MVARSFEGTVEVLIDSPRKLAPLPSRPRPRPKPRYAKVPKDVAQFIDGEPFPIYCGEFRLLMLQFLTDAALVSGTAEDDDEEESSDEGEDDDGSGYSHGDDEDVDMDQQSDGDVY